MLPNLIKPNVDKRKTLNYKVVNNLTLNGKKEKQTIITKILKLDENNQYGMAITKSLPTGCIKNDKDISWQTFNFLLESVSFEDKIGHLYIVDIEFDVKKSNKKVICLKWNLSTYNWKTKNNWPLWKISFSITWTVCYGTSRTEISPISC